MAVDALPTAEASGQPLQTTCRYTALSALFMAIDSHGCLQAKENEAEATMAAGDEVVYYVNRDSQGWVEQYVRRHVYIELKLECTRNRSRHADKAMDDWMCLYCRGAFPSKLRLTDHRVGGCLCGPVTSTGAKWELPVYPNLKTAKQGKDLKLALQRADGELWNNLHDAEVWLDLNPELRDVTLPPLGAKVQVRLFMEATLETLTAYPPPPRDPRPQPKGKAPLPPRHDSAPPEGLGSAFFEIPSDDTEEDEAPPLRPKKRSHADMDQSNRHFRAQGQKQGGEARPSNLPRPSQPAAAGHRVPPHRPIQVSPLQSRSPPPERRAILLPPPPTKQVPPSPAAHVPPDAPAPPDTPATRKETPREEQDLAQGLRAERHAYYVKASATARGNVNMDIPKPAFRPPVQPLGLFHLLACGLLQFDLEHGKFEDFEAQVADWKKHPSYLDRLYAAYGRYCDPAHQVTTQFALCSLLFCLCSYLFAVPLCSFQIALTQISSNGCQCSIAWTVSGGCIRGSLQFCFSPLNVSFQHLMGVLGNPLRVLKGHLHFIGTIC